MQLDREAPEYFPCRAEEAVGSSDESLEASPDVELCEKGPQDVTKTHVAAQHKPTGVPKPQPAKAALWSASRFRTDILAQVAERDRPSQSVHELYEQYVECLRCLKLLRGNSCVRDALMGSDPSPSPSSAGSPRGSCAGQLQEDAQSPPTTAQQESGRLTQKLRMKEQELEALQQVLREREEELKEKEQAHTLACRQATQLSRENADLKAQLAKMREQMQSRGGEDVDANVYEQHARGAGCMESAAAAATTTVLPLCQRLLRKIHAAELTCMAAAGGQNAPLPSTLVAVGTSDGFVKLLDGETSRLHAHISVSRDLPRLVAVDLMQGSGLLLAASSDHVLRLLDLQAQRLLHAMRGHHGPVNACGFLKGGTSAFTASADRTMRLWDLERGQTLRTIRTASPVTGAATHANSGVVVAGHADGNVSTWDPRVGEAPSRPTLVHGDRGIVGLTVSHDGRLVVSQAEDGVVCATSLETLKVMLSLDGLGPVVGPSPPSCSPDGTHVLARGAKSLRCWNLITGERICMHEVTAPTCVCWNLPHAFTAHRSGDAALWDSSEEDA